MFCFFRRRVMRVVIGLILLSFCFVENVDAKTTFLPDWQGAGMETKSIEGNLNKDEPLCKQSGLYHKADGCPAPKIFDEYCPFSDKWISECYCPSVFSETCTSPYKGDVRVTDDNGYYNCDDLWVACCDTTCPSGTSLDNAPGCDGYELNACGDRCYYPYRGPTPDETGCDYGTEDCSDDCGGTRQCCKACVPTASVDESTCEYGTTTCDDGCGGTRTCCDACTPLLTSVDASTCDYGTKQVDNGCGTNVTQCKTCADNGGTADCSGQTTACGANQTETSSCIDCNGTTRYTCEDYEEEETETCSYSTTASDCSSQCKNTGGNSCVINGTTYYDSCGRSLCNSDQVCYDGDCCTPDKPEEPECGCDDWREEDDGCGGTVNYCRKPKPCTTVHTCDGYILTCGARSCCCPENRCYDSNGDNMCDCGDEFDGL